jgi:uncharacterized protein
MPPRKTPTSSTPRKSTALKPTEVLAYLHAHPSFLAEHPELLPHLTPPRDATLGSGVKDFQAFMVDRLKGDLSQVRNQQRELVSISRANMHNQNRVHAAVLALLDAQTFEELIQIIATDFAVLLDVDVVSLVVEANHGLMIGQVNRSGVRIVRTGRINAIMGKKEHLLQDNIEGTPELYAGASTLVQAQALIRLMFSPDAPPGLLAFGSRNPEQFHEGQGTEQISFLARVVERCVRAWLDLPE